MTLEISRDGSRWIDQLIRLYAKIVEDANIPVENLNKANEAILECIEKLRALAA